MRVYTFGKYNLSVFYRTSCSPCSHHYGFTMICAFRTYDNEATVDKFEGMFMYGIKITQRTIQ